MPFRHGRATTILFELNDISQYFREVATPKTVDVAETSAFGSLDKTYVTGRTDGRVTMSGLFDGVAGAIDEQLDAILGLEAPSGGSAEGYILTVAHGSRTPGTVAQLAAIKAQQYAVTSPVGDVVSTSAEFQANGGIDGGVLFSDPTVSQGTGTYTSVVIDNGASSANGGVGHLHVVANTYPSTVIYKIQHSTDNFATQVDLITFVATGIASTDRQRIVLAPGTVVNRYMRAKSTSSPASGAAKIGIAFARR